MGDTNMPLLGLLQSDLVIVAYSNEATRDGRRQIMQITTAPIDTATDHEIKNSNVVKNFMYDYCHNFQSMRFEMLPTPNQWLVVFDMNGGNSTNPPTDDEGDRVTDGFATAQQSPQQQDSQREATQSPARDEQQPQQGRKISFFLGKAPEIAGDLQQKHNQIGRLRAALIEGGIKVVGTPQQQHPLVSPPPAPPVSPILAQQQSSGGGKMVSSRRSKGGDPLVQKLAEKIAPWWEKYRGELTGKALREQMANEFDIDNDMCAKVLNRIRYDKKVAAKKQKDVAGRQGRQSEPAFRTATLEFDSRSNPTGVLDRMPSDTASDE